jgi:CrcB protein
VSGLAQRLDPWGSFPVGTLTVNLAGSALLGLLGGLSESRSMLGPGARLFVFIGVLGGFTTFSTFTYETLSLLRSGDAGRAAANVGASLLLCLLGAFLGYAVGTK